MSGAYAHIAASLAQVRASIAAAARRAGRQPDEVKLIAVSKTHPVAAITAAAQAGQLAFGENTVQEALGKMAQLADPQLEWHFIGHLQSNKAKYIPGKFHWLHSLDSLKLAERLARFAEERSAVLNTLIEVNITQDPAKHGVAPDAVAPLLNELLKAKRTGIALRGLMAIGTHPADEIEQRRAFAALRQLRDQCQQRFALPDFTQLSMGMSDDYVAAILEGATMVRIGSAIFGARDYTR
jgi:hypothetical protein